MSLSLRTLTVAERALILTEGSTLAAEGFSAGDPAPAGATLEAVSAPTS